MDFENFMGFLPLLIFVITVVIDKSNRKKHRNRTGHFPPLPDMDSSRQERGETYDTVSTQQSQKKSTDKTVYKEEFPASGKESKKPWYVEFPEDRKEKRHGKVFEQPKMQQTYKVYNEPAIITPALKKQYTAPAFAMPRIQKKTSLFNGKMNRRRLREGVIMAEILNRPRALKPYKEPY